MTSPAPSFSPSLRAESWETPVNEQPVRPVQPSKSHQTPPVLLVSWIHLYTSAHFGSSCDLLEFTFKSLWQRHWGGISCTIGKKPLRNILYMKFISYCTSSTSSEKSQLIIWWQTERMCWSDRSNIAKGTTDPGVDCFDQSVWFDGFGFGRFCLVGLVW